MGALDTTGRVLAAIPGLNLLAAPFLIPGYLHRKHQQEQMQGAIRQYEKGDQPASGMGALTAIANGQPVAKDLVYPTAPNGSSPPSGGLQFAANGGQPGADPALPASFTPGQSLPRPTGAEIPQGQKIAQGPPQLVTDKPVPGSASKTLLAHMNKIFSPEAMAELKRTNPKLYAQNMAWRGIANFDQGNAQGAVGDLVEAGLPATDAIAILQEQKNQKILGNWGKQLDGSPQANPSAPSVQVPGLPGTPSGMKTGMDTAQPIPMSREQFLRRNPLPANIPLSLRHQAYQMLLDKAAPYKPEKELGLQLAQDRLPGFQDGLSKIQNPKDLASFIASQTKGVPSIARQAFGNLTRDSLSNWHKGYAERQKAQQLAQGESLPTTGAIKTYATRELFTGQKTLLRGKNAGAVQNQIMDATEQIRKQLGLTREEAAAIPSMTQVSKSALLKTVQQANFLDQVHHTIQGHMQVAESQVDHVLKSNVLAANWVTGMLQQHLGSAAYAKFLSTNQALSNEVARYFASTPTGGGQLTDAARAEAANLLNPHLSVEAYKATLKNLQQLMDAKRDAIESERKKNTQTLLHPEGLLGSGSKQKDPSLPEGARKATFQGRPGYIVQKDGQTIFYPEGSNP